MWVADLKFGQDYQRKFVNLITYDSIIMPPGKFKDYDIAVIKDNVRTLYEVKADRKTCSTGNIVIEFACGAEPSGISTTAADFWVYFAVGTGTFYLIPTDEIRKAIDAIKYTKTIRGGDGWRSHMYVFPAQVFEEFKEFYDERAP
jgi:hypothetical protein